VRAVKLPLLILSLALIAFPVVAEDWTTTDGTRYQNVRVIRVEDDAVTIIYKDGGALVFLYKLPPALQQKFDYDPVKAKIAAERRSKEDAENAAELQKEIEQAEIVKHNQQIQNANQINGTASTK
jgi:translation elongation factor P/translation initiation factor 5A